MIPPLVTLQHVVLPRRCETEPLYLSSLLPIDYDPTKQTLRVAPRQAIDFDSYFNSLFESHLVQVSSVKTVYLLLKVSGTFSVQLSRTSEGGLEKVIARQTIGNGSGAVVDHIFPINLEHGRAPLQGRIHFTLTGIADENHILEGCWCVAASDVKRRVSLDAILCTFKREADVKKTAAVLCDSPKLTGNLNRVIIVDNARTLSPDDFSDRRVSLFSQDNYGGAGGFTRGLIESLSDAHSTHFLFMDDDIELDAEVIFRVISYLSVLDRDHAISGGMLDQARPTRMWESGSARHPTRPYWIASHNHNLDLSRKADLLRLNKVSVSEYGAWWLFAVSKSVVQKIGLPLPCFIHVDDIEYSLRLEGIGINNLPIPGIGVWHAPFYAKLPTWMHYYDYRNHLICDSAHNMYSSWQVSSALVTKVFWDLLRFEYQEPRLAIEGAKDYLAGPGGAISDPLRTHEHIMKLAKAHAPRFEDLRLDPITDRKAIPIGRVGVRRFWRLLTMNGHLDPFAGTRKNPHAWAVHESLHHWFAVGGPSVAVKHPWINGFAIYERSPDKFLKITAEVAVVGLKLLLSYPKTRRKWLLRYPELTSIDSWKKYLRMEDGSTGRTDANLDADASQTPD